MEETKEPTEQEQKQDAQAEARAAKIAAVKQALDPEAQIRMSAKGKLELETPIQDGEKTITTLEWDFLALTGSEYCDAMDRDTGAANAFRVTNKQAFALFAAAAAKKTPGLDQIDILSRMGLQDAMKAVQTATIFFFASSRAGNKRLLKV